MPKIMIVDDDKLTVSLLTTLLELDNFQVISVAEGAAALQKARDESPDCFLVDFHLADGPGTEFIKSLRSEDRFRTTPVIMASGLDREEEAEAAGADHFMIKPFEPDDLVSVLNDLLANSQ